MASILIFKETRTLVENVDNIDDDKSINLT